MVGDRRQIPETFSKEQIKRKNKSRGRNVSCFPALVLERDAGGATASLLGATAGLIVAAPEPPLETVRHVDLGRYVGRWFEIARYSNWFERKCDRDVTADYSIKETGDIRVVNACITRTGKIERSEGTAKVVDTSTNAKLKVTFFWPFYGKYWIIDLGDEYEYAVVGEPSRHYLWILSRTPVMQDTVYQKILHQLTANGYEPQKLIRTNQTVSARP